MDPITAVGFAASILTFIDFSYQIISGTFEVIKSGSTAENAHVSVVINDLHDVTKELGNRLPRYSKHEDALNTLASECRDVSEELRKLLEKLKVEAGSPKWKSIKVALRSMWKKGGVAELENRLGKCRSQILLRLVIILNERQVSVRVQLNNLQSQSQKQASDAVKQLTSLRDGVLKSIESTIQHRNETLSLELSEQLRLINEVRGSVNTLLEKPAAPSPEMRILKQLYFNTIYSREDAMEKADSGTYEWILNEESAGTDQGTEREESEDEDLEFQKLEESTKQIRSQSRTTFLTWLRQENKIFHISGKAGSGKSTLMKLLLDLPQTHVELRQWAGDKQLVFAHFFFWRSGDKLQRSLLGLYRSILFETLKQCPDLIREIFPGAYDTFSKNGLGSSIDELFFRPEGLERGMHMLISKSPHPGYRFCFFIDGLDEYGDDGVDSLYHEKLAEDLQLWAAKDDIKILVSSRPHREFQEAFSDDRRIRLHELTRSDIFRFGRNMFKKDKNFSSVQHCYKKLVDTVVSYSDGVFLWARLAIRSLLMATRRSSAVDYLEKQLENIPKDINDLYEELLASINPADRAKAFKMLLLVAEMYELTAVALTWIDDLDDSKFPTSYEIQPYTDDEIKERQSMAKSQLNDFTKGLLEITASTREKKNPFFYKKVQFFHRTLRDFVRQSKHLRDFSAEFPDFMGDEIRIRVLLAELWFAKTEYVTSDGAIESQFGRYPSGKSRDAHLDAFERILTYHQKAGNDYLHGTMTYPDSELTTTERGTMKSFLHWVTWILDDTEYVRRRVSGKPHLLRAKDDLSLIVSASLVWEDNSTMLKTLLDLGASPNEQVKVNHEKYHTATTAWMIFCVCFAARMISDEAEYYKTLFCSKLEEFLATRMVDTNCLILIARGRNPRNYKGDPTHAISLRQLIQQLEPANQATLIKLMSGLGKEILTTLRAAWMYVVSSKSDQSSPQSAYLPFDVSMQPPPPEEEGAHDKDSPYEYRFFVHSVKWGDIQLMAPYLKVRLY